MTDLYFLPWDIRHRYSCTNAYQDRIGTLITIPQCQPEADQVGREGPLSRRMSKAPRGLRIIAWLHIIVAAILISSGFLEVNAGPDGSRNESMELWVAKLSLFFVFGTIYLVAGSALLNRIAWGRQLAVITAVALFVVYVGYFIYLSTGGVQPVGFGVIPLTMGSIFYLTRRHIREYFKY